MQIQVSGRQVEVTPALREYAVSKLERITRHFDHLHDVTVILGLEKLVHRAEATITAARKKVLHAEFEASDMYAALDGLADKLDSQVRKHKEKLTDHHRADAQKARPAV